MRLHGRLSFVCAAGLLAAASFAAGPANPVAPTAASIEDGKKSFQHYCRQCHGADATGGTEVGYAPAAPSLVDDTWKHGSGDGDIYLVIKNGVAPEMFMEPWEDRLTSDQIWNIVNYIRSLKRSPASSPHDAASPGGPPANR